MSAGIFEQIMDMRSRGLNNGEIAKEFNTKRKLTPRGKKFTASSVSYLATSSAAAKSSTPVHYERLPAIEVQPSIPSGYVMVVIGKADQMRDIIAGAMK